MQSEFFIIWASLLANPIFAFIVFFVIRRKEPTVHLKILLTSVFSIFIFSVSNALGITFTNSLANFSSFAIAYLAFNYLVASCWNISQKLLRVFAMLIFMIPIGIGYILGTVGLLGLVFIVGDHTNPPMHTEKLEQNLICRVTTWGMAASDSGYTVRLYRYWNAIPFLERELNEIVVNETSQKPPFGASCNDVLAAYTKLQTR